MKDYVEVELPMKAIETIAQWMGKDADDVTDDDINAYLTMALAPKKATPEMRSVCPRCGGKTHKMGKITRRTGVYQRWICRKCGHQYIDGLLRPIPKYPSEKEEIGVLKNPAFGGEE